MAIIGMLCPHCGEDQVFEANDPIQVKLCFDNWKVGSVASQVPRDAMWTCIGCDGWVNIDFKNRLIRKRDQPVPVYDTVVEGILEFAKEQEKEELARESTVHLLAEKNYRGLSFLTTWGKVVSIILEQRP